MEFVPRVVGVCLTRHLDVLGVVFYETCHLQDVDRRQGQQVQLFELGSA